MTRLHCGFYPCIGTLQSIPTTELLFPLQPPITMLLRVCTSSPDDRLQESQWLRRQAISNSSLASLLQSPCLEYRIEHLVTPGTAPRKTSFSLESSTLIGHLVTGKVKCHLLWVCAVRQRTSWNAQAVGDWGWNTCKAKVWDAQYTALSASLDIQADCTPQQRQTVKDRYTASQTRQTDLLTATHT